MRDLVDSVNQFLCISST